MEEKENNKEISRNGGIVIVVAVIVFWEVIL